MCLKNLPTIYLYHCGCRRKWRSVGSDIFALFYNSICRAIAVRFPNPLPKASNFTAAVTSLIQMQLAVFSSSVYFDAMILSSSYIACSELFGINLKTFQHFTFVICYIAVHCSAFYNSTAKPCGTEWRKPFEAVSRIN